MSLYHKRLITHELWCDLHILLAARTYANDKGAFARVTNMQRYSLRFFLGGSSTKQVYYEPSRRELAF